MNILKTILLLLALIIPSSITSLTYSATTCGNSIFSINCNNNIPYCDPNGIEPCGIKGGIDSTKGQITGIESQRTFSVYIQDIIKYVLGFITLIAVIYIIYAGFTILTGAGDEEKAKKTKNIIIYVLVGMLIIWLAYPIVLFVINILNTGSTPVLNTGNTPI